MYTSTDSFETPPESIFFEDNRVYVALAHHAITEGHTVVVWKGDAADISKLSTNDYEYLMDVVDVARNSLKKQFGVEKVYLLYFDEAQHVHWHLIPRYIEKGFAVLQHEPVVLSVFPHVPVLRMVFAENHTRMLLEN